jgi:hypothetical protein
MKPESPICLHWIVRLLLMLVLCQAPALWAGIPEIASLNDDERIVVREMHSEPAISTREYTFMSGRVVIKSGDKPLGTMEITKDEAVMIDRYIDCIKRARKTNANLLGAPVYTITAFRESKAFGTWEYRIEKPRKSDKPVLPLHELIKRLEKQK